jgi:UDP-N-acetylglucosamine--N-acetylmuramyl-(pentapeptide) pyrophosphoryl-undecaprenol N-acetylglucosamine transferase
MQKGTILLAAGGTGGHLFPAEALAHELIERNWAVHLATDGRAERYAGRFPAATIHPIASATIGSRNPFSMARAFWSIWRGYRQSLAVINAIKPAAVVGFGGYPTLPPVYAATRRGVPTMIHEQNAVMGRANKALAPRVGVIAGGFLPEGRSGVAVKVVTTGNPVRPAVLEAAKSTYIAPGRHAPFHLLVFGGSQGAQFFSDVMPATIQALPEKDRRRIKIVQQARSEDIGKLRKGYAAIGIEAEISPFFTDMPERIADAHLVISRSGASTVSEVAAIGRPAIFVPYPHALDHDQAANAAAMAQAGGAKVFPQASLTPARLSQILAQTMDDKDGLEAMAAAARSTGKPEAARLLADLTEAIADKKSIIEFRGRDRR